MKKYIQAFFLLAFAFILAGCDTMMKKPEPIVIYKTRIQPVPIPAYLLVNCPIPLPPSAETYPKMNPQEKEEALTIYTIELFKSITLCNNTIDSGKKWNEQQMKLFKNPQVQPEK